MFEHFSDQQMQECERMYMEQWVSSMQVVICLRASEYNIVFERYRSYICDWICEKGLVRTIINI